ncbi:MAG: hypothetical protein M0O93_00015 [Bacteroidales bacterium]|nr:hypothetical protein [Bacteroidales bacterium]
MVIKRLVLTLLVFSIGLNVSAQRFKEFSGNSDSYIDELIEFYKSDVNMKKDKQKEYEELIINYATIWNSIPSQQKQDVMSLSNQMLKKRVRPVPGFFDFIETQVAFQTTNQSKESYNQWFKGLQWTIESSTLGAFNEAINTSLNLVKFNSLYTSRTVNWTVKHNGYNIRIDTNRGPYVDFTSSIDLTYSSQKDQNTLYSTNGKFYIVEQFFEGKGGRIDFSRAGLPKDQVYAELSKYTVSLKRAAIFADSVQFTNKEYFQHKLHGSLEDQCSDKVKESSFPRFFSYKREEIIKNIFPDVDYVGGFTQQGGKFLGTGDAQEPAELVFKKEGKLFCKAKAITHPFSQEGITTPDCQITFYINNDSIYHPGLLMRYNKNSREIACINNKEGISASPWVDSYHAIDIYTEAVYVELDSHILEFTSVKGPANSVSFASFESNNYYTQLKWDKIQGIDETNPIYRVKGFVDKYKKKNIPVKEFARYIGMDETQAEVMLMRLAISGFINYESYRKTAIIKDKIYDYIMANIKRQDYDNIRFVSSTKKGANAVLNILDMDLRMYGIENFSLSDTHFVNISPVNGEIVMKKNRSFEFNGRVTAGRFIMGGEKCYFDYERFALNLPKIDSMAFFVPLFEDTNKIIKIQTPLQNLVCELLIDDPKNKSSIKRVPGYPMLSSLEDSYVYYDQPKIQGGVYLRENFYYKLDPFKLKDLMTFKTDSVKFTGVLKSAGIFADIKEPLKVMKDYSLGFIIKTPNSGMLAYGGKGKFYNQIDLSLQGLLGAGYLEYIASRSDSRMFVFLPDSMNSKTDKFICSNKSTVEFPEVTVTKTSENWYPYKDYMIVHQAAEPFYMFGGEALHTGSLIVSPIGLTGKGSNKAAEMIVAADNFKFKSISYTADTANFTLMALNGQDIAFNAKEVKSMVDFKTKRGEFKSMEGVKPCDLTYLQYSCEVDKFDWIMDAKELALLNSNSTSVGDFPNKKIRNLIDLEQPGAKFTATNPVQKGLTFNSVNATLSLKDNKLRADEVFLIRSGDAAIQPTDPTIIIRPGAQMDTIEDARILIDTETRIHEFYSSRVHIFSSSLYSANGYIDYVDENKKKHPIFVSRLNPDPISSRATGSILKETPLQLSPAFNFYGKVQIDAKDSNYLFEGGVQLSHNCNENLAFITFKSRVDSKNIYIPISEAPSSVDGQRVTASLQYNPKTMEPKSAFLTNDIEADNTFMTAKGYLTYDKLSNEYRIASMEKLEDMKEGLGDYLILNKTSCDAKGQGNINIGLSKSGIVEMQNYGEMKINNSSLTADLNMSLGIKFPFSPLALDYMGVELYEDMNLSPLEFEVSKYQDQLVSIYGSEKGLELYEDLLITGEWKEIPKKMDYTLYFSNVKMQWDPILNSYVSYGDAELSIVGKHQVNKKIRAKIQLVKTSISNEIRIYIEANPDHWYFFTYNGASMSAISSYEIFNDFIKEVPNKDREFKAADGKIFTYRLATPNEKINYIRKLEKIDEFENNEE